jgi:tripartite-type tricarboxylate transporter receptor subunit TctC
MLDRRRFLGLAAAAAAPAILPSRALGDSWPTKPVRIVVPFTPGGSTDITARLVGNRLQEIWGQSVVIENKGGAGGNIAADLVAHSDADGYTILISGPGMATNRFLYAQLSYDPVGDFAPVTMLITQPNMMCVPNTSPAKSVKEFIDFCNANKGKVTYASSGNGTTLHLSGELFKRLAKVEMTHIPYRGGAPAINDLIPGRVDVIFDNMPSIVSHVRSGSVRGIAVSTRDRVAVMPDMPTIAETVPGFDVFSWFGFFVPIKTSADVVAKINADTNAALVYPAVKVALRGSRRGAQGLDTSRARRLPAVGNRQVGPGDPRRADQAGKLRAEDDPCCWPSPTPQASWLASRSRSAEKALTSQMFGETE